MVLCFRDRAHDEESHSASNQAASRKAPQHYGLIIDNFVHIYRNLPNSNFFCDNRVHLVRFIGASIIQIQLIQYSREQRVHGALRTVCMN